MQWSKILNPKSLQNIWYWAFHFYIPFDWVQHFLYIQIFLSFKLNEAIFKCSLCFWVYSTGSSHIPLQHILLSSASDTNVYFLSSNLSNSFCKFDSNNQFCLNCVKRLYLNSFATTTVKRCFTTSLTGISSTVLPILLPRNLLKVWF